MVVLMGNGENRSFGAWDEQSIEQDTITTTAAEIQFADQKEVYYLSITAPVSPGDELTVAFLHLLPYLLMLILLISTLGRFCAAGCWCGLCWRSAMSPNAWRIWI